MASNSSKNIDHGNYIPSPIVPGIKIADGEHLRKVFVLGSADAAAGADIAESSALRAPSRHPQSGCHPLKWSRAAMDSATSAPTADSNNIVTEHGASAETPVGSTGSPTAKTNPSVAERVEATVGSTGSPTTKVTEIPSNIEVGADAALDLTVIVLPGVSARIPLTIDLTGAHSEVRLSGIYLCSGHDEVTFDITMHHRTGDCRSQQTFNGLATGEAKCGFFGKIVIAPDAQRTEAFQENHNILLSDTARVNTKPRLEIYADDVKCSHGATVGKLNEDEQFYMRSRGIPEDEAKVLQMISFVAPVLETIPEEATCGDLSRSAVAGLVENAIRCFA